MATSWVRDYAPPSQEHGGQTMLAVHVSALSG